MIISFCVAFCEIVVLVLVLVFVISSNSSVLVLWLSASVLPSVLPQEYQSISISMRKTSSIRRSEAAEMGVPRISLAKSR